MLANARSRLAGSGAASLADPSGTAADGAESGNPERPAAGASAAEAAPGASVHDDWPRPVVSSRSATRMPTAGSRSTCAARFAPKGNLASTQPSTCGCATRRRRRCCDSGPWPPEKTAASATESSFLPVRLSATTMSSREATATPAVGKANRSDCGHGAPRPMNRDSGTC